MAKSRRSYKGAAVSNTIGSAGLSSGTTTIPLTSAMSGWPTGTNPFFIVIDPGTSKEEKVCVVYTNSTTLTVVDPAVTSSWSASANGRGVDDTTDRNHDSGAIIYPVFTAYEANQANELVATYAHQGAVVYQGASTFAELTIGTAGQVLKVNSGATAPEWGTVAEAGIASGAVTEAKLASNAVTNAKVADDAIDTAEIKNSAVTLAKLASAVQNFLVPVGTIAMYGGATAPTGWLLCDGTSTSGYTALAAIVGATTPDLKGRFAIGDNSTLTLLGTGGSTTIAEANLPSHKHAVSLTSGTQSANHSHSISITDPGHDHDINRTTSASSGAHDNANDYVAAGTNAATTGTSTAVIASATTGISASAGNQSADHTHSVSGDTATTGSGTAYYQPYVVVNYIIKHD